MKLMYRRVKPKIPKKFEAFKTTPKGIRGLMKTVRTNKHLQKAMNAFSVKKTLYAAGGSTAVGFLAKFIVDYIHNNSGCFMYNGSKTCKVKELSCCQPEPVHGVPFCDLPKVSERGDPCHGFDEDRVGSCCIMCDCKNQVCTEGQTMECRRPTVSEALAAAAENIAKGVGENFLGFLKYFTKKLSWIFGIVGAILLGGFVWFVWNKVK